MPGKGDCGKTECVEVLAGEDSVGGLEGISPHIRLLDIDMPKMHGI